MPTKIPDKEDLPLPKPEQITIAWLKQHASLSWWKIFWISLISVFGFVFGLGFIGGNWDPISAWVTKHLEKGLDTNSPKNNADNSDSENVQSLSRWDYRREILNILNHRIDFSFKGSIEKIKASLGAEQLNSPAFLAFVTQQRNNAQQTKQAILGLMSEIDRIYCQIEEVTSSKRNSGRILFPDELEDELNLCVPLSE